jgi:hypothetical protein
MTTTIAPRPGAARRRGSLKPACGGFRACRPWRTGSPMPDKHNPINGDELAIPLEELQTFNA